MKYIEKYNSPLGKITLVSDGEFLTELAFDGQKYFDIEVPADAVVKSLPIFEEASRWLDLYFRGQEADFMPPLAMSGSDFRMKVWAILKNIPYGEVITYGEISKQVAEKRGITRMSAQAVGGAVGHNPVSIIVPCHRVVGQNGNLTGYAGGIDRKIELLKIERSYQDSFYIPKKGTAL
jgi:methylated-DNA-[protein]-cysteine S-methyltransferase